MGPHISVEPVLETVRVVVDGTEVGRSQHAQLLREGDYAPVYYVPTEDIDWKNFKSSKHTSFCPWKGTAIYQSAVIGDKTYDNVAWSYEQDKKIPEIHGLWAFWKEAKVEVVEE